MRSRALFLRSDAGSTTGGVLLAVLIIAAVGVAAFFYFGGRVDGNVKIKKPDVSVSSSETPSN